MSDFWKDYVPEPTRPAPIKGEGMISDPDEYDWKCDCAICEERYRHWKNDYDVQQAALRNEALDKKAENARELGLDYEPVLKDNSNYRYDPPFAEPDYKALWQQMCERCDELDKELSATDRQVEILSDALAESRREVAAPVQEPVAYLCENAVGHKYFRWKKPSSEFKPIALYTTPPAAQRQWVGLTNNELQPIADEYRILFGGWVEDFARAIEAKLKEKNT